ncbi:acyltransferase family protein [Mycobacterium sp.]|uniref:acyltransferase family protein n=1 Tax=Mycobacterium sp. TaxID=1785 RepID=UPI0031DB4109
MRMQQAGTVGAPGRVSGGRASERGFRSDIEGLRAVAVLAVVLFHAGVPGITGGFVGVDVFFVISGFLITGMLWREVSGSGTIRLGRFYGARARRLLPASATVGVVTAIGSAILLPPLQAREVFADGIASALYAGNYRFATQGVDYLAASTPPSPFQHYWSLGVEEQFYLVWPALIIGAAWLSRRVRRRAGAQGGPSERPYLVALGLVAAASFAMSLMWTYTLPPAAFFWLQARAWELAAGGLVALTASQWRRLARLPAAIAGWVGLAVILFACHRLGAATPYPGIAALLPVLGTVLVVGAGCAAPSLGIGRALSLGPMRAVGRVSYSWYLWHWPVLLLAPPLLGHPLGLSGRLATAAISGGLAVLTLRLVENPVRFFAGLRGSPARSLALGGAVTAVAVCTGVVLLVVVPVPVGRGAPARALKVTALPPPGNHNADPDAAVRNAFVQVQAAVAASADLKAVPSNLNPPLADASADLAGINLNGCLRSFLDFVPPVCAKGDTASPTTVALVGDSNATMWSPAFEQVANQQRWRLEILGKAACPPTDLAITNPLLHRKFTECPKWRDRIIARLQAEHPRLIVVSMWRRYTSDYGFTPYNSAWTDQLTVLVTRLRATGAQVLVLGPVPDPGSRVPDCLSSHLDDATACSPLRSSAVDAPGVVAEAAATRAGGGQYADLTDLFCTADRCPVIVGNTLVYRDHNHLTAEYVRELAPVIGALADRALARG